MERKLRNATSKLRNLKDFLSSTRSLSQQGPSSASSAPHNHHHKAKGHRKSSGSGGSGEAGGRPTLSISLFDLVDPPLCSSRPSSMAFSGHSYGKGPPSYDYDGTHNPHASSVSMYGLAGAVSTGTLREDEYRERGQGGQDLSIAEGRQGVLSTRNPALRLFYTIRSKFRRRKRDRLNKITDSKSTNDFGPFLSGAKYPLESSSMAGNQIPGSSTRYHLEANRVPGSQSVDHLDCIGDDFDNSFASPLGYRDRNYEVEKEYSTTHITTSTTAFMIEDNNHMGPTASTSGDPVSNPAYQLSNFNNVSPNSTHRMPEGAARADDPDPCPSTKSEPKLKGLAKELFDLIHFGWYWGGMSKEDAEEKLKDEPDGAFIVRDSSSSLHLLTLSFNSNGKTKHTRIEYVDGKFSFMSSETESFPSVAELIQHWIQNTERGILCYSKSSRNNAPTSYPVRLTKPISRYTEVKSLRFLSSFVIYQYTRLDLIPKLPLPPPLINFIGQQRFLGN